MSENKNEVSPETYTENQQALGLSVISVVIILMLLLIIYVVSTTSFNSYSQFETWKGQMSAMHLDESFATPIIKDKGPFNHALTQHYDVFSGDEFSRICEAGNDNANKVRNLTTIQNRFIDDNPVVVRINLDFGCKNMDYNPQTHETTYAGKIVRFYVPQATDLPLSQ